MTEDARTNNTITEKTIIDGTTRESAVTETRARKAFETIQGLNTRSISRADLMLLIRTDNPEEHDAFLNLLGYERVPEKIPETKKNEPDDETSPKSNRTSQHYSSAAKPRFPGGYVCLTHLSFTPQPNQQNETDHASVATKNPNPEKGRHKVSTAGYEQQPLIPLVPWQRIWPAIRNALAQWRRSERLHLPKLIRSICQGKLITQLPYRHRLSWATEGEILFDFHERLSIFFDDINLLADRLSSSKPQMVTLKSLFTQNDDDGVLLAKVWGKGKGRQRQPYSPSPLPVILFSDLGCYDPKTKVRESWITLGQQWLAFGVRPTVFMPCPPLLWDVALKEYYHLVHWDVGVTLPVLLPPKPQPGKKFCRNSLDLLPTVIEENTDTGSEIHRDSQAKEAVQSLLVLSSPILGMELPILRHLRVLFTDFKREFQGYGAALEFWTWFDPQVSPGRNILQMHHETRSQFRQSFASTLTEFNPQQRVQILQCLLQAHSSLHETVWYEEVTAIGDLVHTGEPFDQNAISSHVMTEAQQVLYTSVQDRIQFLTNLLKKTKDRLNLHGDSSTQASSTLMTQLEMNGEDLASYGRRQSQRQRGGEPSNNFWQKHPAYRELYLNSLRDHDIKAIHRGDKKVPEGFPLEELALSTGADISSEARTLTLSQRGSFELVLSFDEKANVPVGFDIEQQHLLRLNVSQSLISLSHLSKGIGNSLDGNERRVLAVPKDKMLSLGSIEYDQSIRFDIEGYCAELKHLSKPVWAEEMRKRDGLLLLTTPQTEKEQTINESKTLQWVNPGEYGWEDSQTQPWWIEDGRFWDQQDIVRYFVTHPETLQPELLKQPKWAQSFGQDEYGIYADVTLFGVNQRFRWILPGQFRMGSPNKEQGRDIYEVHKEHFKDLESADYDGERAFDAVLTRSFWLAETACTQELWQRVMDDNPSHFKGDQYPVESVSWDDIQGFIKKINQRYPELKLMLPNEAQWEYACRAGTETPYYFGEAISHEQVHFSTSPGDAHSTIGVKAKPANAWGLYQMHGNVWEWCQNRFGPYPENQAIDPSGPVDQRFKHRVLRGGSWYNSDAGLLRSAFRSYGEPDGRVNGIGFRLALG